MFTDKILDRTRLTDKSFSYFQIFPNYSHLPFLIANPFNIRDFELPKRIFQTWNINPLKKYEKLKNILQLNRFY